MVRSKTIQNVQIDKLKLIDDKLGNLKEKPCHSSSFISSLNKSSDSDKYLNQVGSDKGKKLEKDNYKDNEDTSKLKSSLDDSQEKFTKTQRRTRKYVKAKPKELSDSNQDLSSKFNQYS